jgi:hypothetical protein
LEKSSQKFLDIAGLGTPAKKKPRGPAISAQLLDEEGSGCQAKTFADLFGGRVSLGLKLTLLYPNRNFVKPEKSLAHLGYLLLPSVYD